MVGKIRYICIDDDPLSNILISELLFKKKKFESHGLYTDVLSGIESYEKNTPDVIFLDIEMPTMSGIDFLKKVRKGKQIFVLTASHPEFALEGYELNVFDYLLKPLDENRFYSTIRRIEELVSLREKAESFDILFNQENIHIKEGHTHVKIHLNDIIYIEALQDYSKIITPQKNYVVLSTLSSLIDKLPKDKFMRIHRSYVVSLKKVKSWNTKEVICEGASLPVGKTYKSAIAQMENI